MTGAADPLRPAAKGLGASVAAWAIGALPGVFAVLRTVRPIVGFGNTVLVTRYDDVREVFENDAAFRVPYAPKLDVIMGGQPFFLGMDDTERYRRDVAAMRSVVRPEDIPARLGPATEAAAAHLVAAGNGRVEVVDLVRSVTFEVLADYLGVAPPPDRDLRVWATRLFEFQFADPSNDAALRAEVDVIAPALRGHIQSLIERRRAGGAAGDDVLGRCLQQAARGVDGFSDDQIRTSLMGFVVGGPPQPPMVVPQAMEQLLRRPDALRGAQAAARSGDDAALAGYVFEAMRFDPLAPALPRLAARDTTIAVGTARARTVHKDTNVLVSMMSAMQDGRRLPEPARFDSTRPAWQYMHFGHGLHACFGAQINRTILPLLLKPLLAQDDLRRAPGADGHLRKRGAFAERLVLDYAPPSSGSGRTA